MWNFKLAHNVVVPLVLKRFVLAGIIFKIHGNDLKAMIEDGSIKTTWKFTDELIDQTTVVRNLQQITFA